MSNQHIIGNSPALREALTRASRVAPTQVSVLIEGETGTGKELFARHVHELSARSAGPFIAVNCAAIPRELFESLLFGHERGAFSGAIATTPGAFERAHNGTLFLDEIGDMPLDQQPKVLRAIQEREVERVGGTAPRAVDVRVIAATHRDLESVGFREDLRERIAGYRLRIPPLRERRSDVLTIAKQLLELEFPTKYLSREVQAIFVAHAWPNNVRELENVVRAVAIDSPGRRIDVDIVLQHPSFAGGAPSLPRATTDRLSELHAFLALRGRATAADVRSLFHIERTRAYQLLAEWERRGEILRVGVGRGTFYVSASERCDSYPVVP